MDENEIRASIQRKRDRISGYQSEIDKLKIKIADLEEAHGKVNSRQKSFEESQEARRGLLSSVENCFTNPKIKYTYATGMRSFLSGTEYTNAYDACNSEIEYLKSLLV